MNEYIISGESPADLSEKHFLKRDIRYVCFHYMLDGVEYYDDLGKTMPLDQFYESMLAGAETKTSQVSCAEYIEYFTPLLEEGKDIIHFCLSSGLSGSFNSANAAKDTLLEQYPDRKLYVVDSLAASSGFGLLLDKVADLRDEGYSIEELYNWVEENKLHLHHWFYSTDLTFYVKGGRVSRVSGWFGTILQICPLLNVDMNGKLIPREKVRTKQKVMAQIIKKMEEHAENGLEYAGKCFISHSGRFNEAKEVATIIQERFPNLDGKVVINNIGTTIGSHSGPGTIALFFWGDKRED